MELLEGLSVPHVPLEAGAFKHIKGSGTRTTMVEPVKKCLLAFLPKKKKSSFFHNLVYVPKQRAFRTPSKADC